MQMTDPWHSRLVRHRASRHTTRGLTPVLALLLSVVALLAGVWLSLGAADWRWFARSGALLVVIGMFLTSSQIIHNNRRLHLRRSPPQGQFQHDYADAQWQQIGPVREEQEVCNDHLRGLYLLVAGTLIWGFGDLVGELLAQLLKLAPL